MSYLRWGSEASFHEGGGILKRFEMLKRLAKLPIAFVIGLAGAFALAFASVQDWVRYQRRQRK